MRARTRGAARGARPVVSAVVCAAALALTPETTAVADPSPSDGSRSPSASPTTPDPGSFSAEGNGGVSLSGEWESGEATMALSGTLEAADRAAYLDVLQQVRDSGGNVTDAGQIAIGAAGSGSPLDFGPVEIARPGGDAYATYHLLVATAEYEPLLVLECDRDGVCEEGAAGSG
ncbi:hypothetical protein FHX37_4230 [Haloactinospora alba]|uniref:Uncharacterized protein n=1 Tax=Haloactinospora alba TaxID=405555 RepID=A0A543N6Q8_9ACTN|nr:hypothetical protein [Haloactinospora alba]TQN27509.1 hypothetical protein FHX37_4230 [Haloactinospora alba]